MPFSIQRLMNRTYPQGINIAPVVVTTIKYFNFNLRGSLFYQVENWQYDVTAIKAIKCY